MAYILSKNIMMPLNKIKDFDDFETKVIKYVVSFVLEAKKVIEVSFAEDLVLGPKNHLKVKSLIFPVPFG